VPDPESRYTFGNCFWIPGSLALLAPRNDGEETDEPAPSFDGAKVRDLYVLGDIHGLIGRLKG
jgi:hypothetical protein